MKNHLVKSIFAIIILSTMVLALFACDSGEAETEAPTSEIQSESESDNTVESESSSDSSESESADSESETETACVHNYTADENGHWKPACDICGKPSGSPQVHEVSEKIKDRGDRLAYIYYCTVCDYVVYKQELSYDINVYIPPTDLAAADCYNLSATYFFEDNVGFTRFTSKGSGAYITAYADTACEDVSGRYLIMKARMQGGSSMSLQVRSNNASSAVMVNASELGGEWATLIIDLAAIGNGKDTGYAPDGGGDYYLSHLRIYFDGNTLLPAGGYADISYMTVVETIEDAYEFVGEGNLLYIYHNIATNPFPVIEGASCEHNYVYNDGTHSMSACEKCGVEAVTDAPHTVTEKVSGETYTYVCECGYTYDTSKVVSSDVNTFLSPSFIAKHANNSAIWSGGELLYEEGGEPFARIYGKDRKANGSYIEDSQKIWNPYANGIAVTGQYLVIKYRVPDNNLKAASDKTSAFTQSQIRIYTSTQRSGATDETDGFYLPVSEDNQWRVAIINLAFSVGNSKGSTFVAAEDGTYTMRFMQLRLFFGGISTETDHTDIAYIGFCDKLDEAVSLVEEDEYYWQCKKGQLTGYNVKKSEGPNPEDEIPEGTTPEPEPDPADLHNVTETVKDGIYSYTCSHCDMTVNDLEVPSSVEKFYSPVTLFGADQYQAVKTMMIDEDGNIFTRLKGKSGLAFEYYFVNRQGSPETDVGAFRYMILRMRTSNAAKHINLVLKVNDTDVSIRVNNSMKSGEWTTLVIDMDAVSKIAPDSNGACKITHLYIYTQALESEYIDIAYAALCDSWSDVTPLASDEAVTLITHTSNAGGKVSAADGSCVAHVPTETVSGNTYTYTCASCKAVISTKTVPSDTNLFLSSSSLNSTYAAKHELIEEDGIVFKRFTTTAGGAHIYVRNKATLADAGKLLVMKIRASSDMSAFVIQAGSDNFSSSEQNPTHNRGAWRTVVIDLAQFANYNVDAEGGNVQIRFDLYGNNPGYTLDVAYIAIVDDRAEARALIDDETYEYYSSWKVKPVTVETAKESCDTCLVTETKKGNTYSYSDCAICGRSFADAAKTVSEDIAKYYSAGQLAAMSKYNASVSLMADASGEAFARITSNSGGAYEYYIVNKNGSPATSVGESARYVVFKVRMTEVPLECKFSLGSTGGGGAVLYFSLSVTQKNEWVTVVADMDTISKLMPSDGGSIDISRFYMYTGSTGTAALDISAVAFCNSWDEIAEISGSDTAMLMTIENAKGTPVSTTDGKAK